MIRMKTGTRSAALTNRRPNDADRGAGSVRVQTFGACAIDVSGSRLGPASGTQFSLLLLLVHAPGWQRPTSQLLSLLWPTTPDARRRGNLRQILYRLRGLGVDISFDGPDVRLNGSQIAPTFSTERTPEAFERDITRGSDPFGPFLPGYAPVGPAPLVEWLEAEREVAHADARRVLVTLLRARRERADWSGAELLARWLLQFDALNEDATLTLAECAALSGAKHEALRIIDRYLEDIGPGAADIRVPATTLRRRIAEPAPRRLSFAPTERHFVGRDEELRELTLNMRRAKWHDGSATLLHGPAGMGKTRLTEELAKVAALEGIHEVRASCRESDASRPLSVFLDVVPDLLKMPGALGCSPEAMRSLKRFAFDEDADCSSHESDAYTYANSFGARRSAILELILAIAEERTLLVVIEDVHWIDSQSWEILVDLVNRCGDARVYLVLTSREPHARPARPDRIPASLGILRLEGLSDVCSRQLARAICADLSADVDDRLGDWFAQSSEGVPLFLRSLVHHWIETGDAGGVPPSLSSLIQQRLEKLPIDALATLRCIALLGRHATVGVVSKTLEMPAHRALAALEALEKAGIFVSGRSSLYECHELPSRAATESMGLAARQLLHSRIAQILLDTSQQGNTPGMLTDALQHLAASGESARYLLVAEDAAKSLINKGNAFEALCIVGDALRVLSDRFNQRRFLELEAEALYQCGEFARLVAHPLSPPTLIQDVVQPSVSSPSTLIHAIEAAYMADAGDDSSELGLAATLLAERPDVAPEIRIASSVLALRICTDACDKDSALRACFAGRMVVAEVENRELASAHLDMLYHTTFGDLEIARASALRLLPLVPQIPSTTERLALENRLGFALRHCGERTIATRIYQSIVKEAENVHLQSTAALAALRLSAMALDAGDMPEAQHWAIEFARLAPAEREPHMLLLLNMHEARLALELGNLRKAETHLALLKSGRVRRGTIIRRQYLLGIELHLARLRPAQHTLELLLNEACELFDQARVGVPIDYFASQAALALADVGRAERGRALLRSYLSEDRRKPEHLPGYVVASLHALERLEVNN